MNLSLIVFILQYCSLTLLLNQAICTLQPLLDPFNSLDILGKLLETHIKEVEVSNLMEGNYSDN
jgi:hypothetical protein